MRKIRIFVSFTSVCLASFFVAALLVLLITSGPPICAQAAAPQANAAPAGGPWISCSTLIAGGFDTYFTGVFQTAKPVRHLGPKGIDIVDPSVLNDFYAYLNQKGYKFKPRTSGGCDVSPTEAAAKAAQLKSENGARVCASCGKVVETGWTE
jgi:hypothetical protein